MSACAHTTLTCVYTTLRPHHCVNRFFKHFEHCLPVINKTNTCRIICVAGRFICVSILYPQFNTCSSVHSTTHKHNFFSLQQTIRIFESHTIECALQSHSTTTKMSKNVDSYNIFKWNKNICCVQ